MSAGITEHAFVASDGVRLNVLEAGPPGGPHPAILFVPGWCMPAGIWRAQLAALGERFRVAALDPRGQGGSDVPATGYHVDRRANDIAEFRARYGRALLVGWSLGVLEALHFVHRHGDHGLAGLVLVDSSVGEGPATPPATAFLDSLRNDREAAVRAFVRAMFRTARPEGELEALVAGALRMDLEASLSLFPSRMPRTQWRDVARGFPGPLLYVATPQFAAQGHELARHRGNTRVEVFDRAGHALFVDEPQRFNELVAVFAREVFEEAST